MSRKPRRFDEPSMSDKTLLLNVEDLINVAFGRVEGNTVDFKMMQTILHILARELRLLEQDVEIRIAEENDKLTELKEGVEQMQTETMSDDEEEEQEIEITKKKDGKKKKQEKKQEKSDSKGEKDLKEYKDEMEDDKTLAKDKRIRDRLDKSIETERKEKGIETDRKDKSKSEKDEKRLDKDEERLGKTKAQAEVRGKDSEAGLGKTKAQAEVREKDGETGLSKTKVQAEVKGKDDEARRKKEKAGRSKTKQKVGKQKSDVEEKEERSSEAADAGRSLIGGKASKRGIDKEAGISISEEIRMGVQGDKEKILVVEKGPTTRDSRSRVGSIEVVSRSEFDLLESQVRGLVSLKGPLPMPTMPDNLQLKSALAKGTATLPDTMEAMQVNARVQAAEKALTCMADLLTQLAAAGAIPPELADRVDQMTCEVQELSAVAEAGLEGLETFTGSGVATDTHKSVSIDPLSRRDSDESRMDTSGKRTPGSGPVSSTVTGASLAAKISATIASKMSSASIPTKGVTQDELEEALALMKTELMTKLVTITAKDSMTAEHANTMAKSVSEKLEIALRLDERISSLFSLTKDYAEQLSGFDSGLTTQMKSFQEQMMQMRSDLQGGLTHLDTANNNAETAAVADLRTAYDSLVTELETTLHTHTQLVVVQKQLGDELRGLIEWVEMLREQKADRDEVKDGLRDKADLSRLKGLLNEDSFDSARKDLNKRLDMCYEKFHKQDFVWMGALKDLTNVAGTKAELTELIGLKESATDQLRELYETMQKLEIMLGEPIAALVMRKLSAGAHCGACLVPALMPPQDALYGTPAPLPPLPLHDQPPESESCTTELKIVVPPDTREHICNRWVGGSHTLVSEHVTRERAPSTQFQGVPSKRYAGYGTDGRLYLLEEELQPCTECNLSPREKCDDAPPPSAAGDGDHNHKNDG